MNLLRNSIAAAVTIMRALLITDFISSEARGWAQIALIVFNIATLCLPKVAQHRQEGGRRKKLRKRT